MNLSGSPFISVCIPTYKRPVPIRRILESLKNELTAEVEVSIRDDSPDGETERVVREVLKETPALVSYVRGERLGIDGGTIYSVEHAHGIYAWMLGDDDEVLPGALTHVIETLKKNPEIVFAWASYSYDGGKSAIPCESEDRFFKNRDDILLTLQNRFSLISTFIFKREAGLAGLEHSKKRIGSWWSILVLVLTAISNGDKFFFFKGPLFISHPMPPEEIKKVVTMGKKIDNQGFVAFGIQYPSILLEFKELFSRRAMRLVVRKNFSYVWRGMVVGWVRGYDSPKGKRIPLISRYWSFFGCWVAIFLFALPRPLVAFLYHIYERLVRGRKPILNDFD